ncbi:MAG TPA: hypothetical protein EYP04_08860 [Anaerolineae bacterium]|nr:hypothetical protein [Anaerolineae bacterium]
MSTQIRDCAGRNITDRFRIRDVHYWEAFAFEHIWLRSANPNLADDTFVLRLPGPGTRGTHTVKGVAKGAGNWRLPATFEPDKVPEAGGLPSSYERPAGWEKIPGTAHDMTVTWDCCCGKHCVLVETEPQWALTLRSSIWGDCPVQIPIYDIDWEDVLVD